MVSRVLGTHAKLTITQINMTLKNESNSDGKTFH